MWKTKLGMNCLAAEVPQACEMLTLYRETGFEAFFTGWKKEFDVAAIRAHADSLGMIYQSIHAPFLKAAAMWESGEAADAAVTELLDCLHDCAANDVPLMICHAMIGFDKHTPTQAGLEHYGQVVREAGKLGVKIAFENTEGEEYLAALMEAFRGESHVGFCWDVGHQMCYNGNTPMMELYGDRLFGTHLNDNLGVKDFDGKITPRDDLHLLPYDGVNDWTDIACQLRKWNYDGILTFELSQKGQKGRPESDVYRKMTTEEYVVEAYKRACRFAVEFRRVR